jgi:hypothetical protein
MNCTCKVIIASDSNLCLYLLLIIFYCIHMDKSIVTKCDNTDSINKYIKNKKCQKES